MHSSLTGHASFSIHITAHFKWIELSGAQNYPYGCNYKIYYVLFPSLFLPLTSSFLTQNVMVHITTNSSSLTVKDSMSVTMMMGVTIIMSNIMA